MVIDTTKDNSFDSSTDAVVPQHKQLYRGEKKNTSRTIQLQVYTQ